MSKPLKITLCIALSFMFCFISVGYAALTTSLSVHGDSDIQVPKGLFITNIKALGTSNVDSQTVTYVGHSTTVETTINRANSGAGAVTYEITVFNNTDQEYSYRNLYYQTNADGYNNSYISESLNNWRIAVVPSFPDGKTVAPGKPLTFRVTYTVGSYISASSDWKLLINYQFGINISSEEEARETVIIKFTDILNTDSTYETLAEKIDDKFDGRDWTSNYIGNVADSSSDDSTTINTLFAGQLQININGVPTPATVLIKRENVDGDTSTGDDYTAVNGKDTYSAYGCEMTLYLTTSDLSSKGTAPVYAAVFTCNRDADGNYGDWYMIGDLYEGQATVVGYEGGDYTGSFDTGTWRSVAATYSPTEDYSYSVSRNQTIQTIMAATADNRAKNELKYQLEQAKALIDGQTYAGSAMVALEELYNKASVCYTVDANGNITINNGLKRALVIHYITEFDALLAAFENV